MSWKRPEILEALKSMESNPTSICSDELFYIMNSTVTDLVVEFLLVGTPEHNIRKPHVIFHLTLKRYHEHQDSIGCLISMEYIGGGPHGTGGVFTIKSAEFPKSHTKATGAFGFAVTPTGKLFRVRDWVRVLLGRYNQQLQNSMGIGGDMTEFDFKEVQGHMDGCRDWITQAFTRFYLMNLVTLCGIEMKDTPALYKGEQEVIYLDFNKLIPKRMVGSREAPFWFPDIIDKRFSVTSPAQKPLVITIERIKMWRGRFHDPNVVRYELVKVLENSSTLFSIDYNYHPPSRPGSAGYPSGGGLPPPNRPSGANASSSSGGGNKPTGKITAGNKPTGNTTGENRSTVNTIRGNKVAGNNTVGNISTVNITGGNRSTGNNGGGTRSTGNTTGEKKNKKT